MKLNSVTITLVPAPTEEVRELLVALDRGLAAAYDADQQYGLPMDELFRPGIQFFLARAAGEAVGCGAWHCLASMARSSGCMHDRQLVGAA